MSNYLIQNFDDILPTMRSIQRDFEKHGSIEVSTDFYIPGGKRRSLSQNKSLHLYCDKLAFAMTIAGITQKELVGSFKEGFTLPVTGQMIKEIFREVGKAMFKKESTADLSTIEMQEVYRAVDARFGEITGVRMEWPCINPPIPGDEQ
jgi:hypothetical protein